MPKPKVLSKNVKSKLANVKSKSIKPIVTTKDEKTELAELEDVINRNLASFFEIGKALITIRDKKLYHLTHDNFEDYVLERWDFRRAHAYRLIDSAKTIENLSPIGDIPTNEAQVRPLTKLDPDHQKEAWAEALKSAPQGKVTAKLVRKVVKKMIPESEREQKKATTIKRAVEDVSPKLMKAWEAMSLAIKEAKLQRWESTSKKEALRLLNSLIDFIDKD